MIVMATLMASSSTQDALLSQPETFQVPPVNSQRRWADLGLVLLVGIFPLVVSAVYELFSPVAIPKGAENFRFLTGVIHEIVTLILLICLLTRQQRTLQSIGFGFQWLDVPKGLGLFIASWIVWYSVAFAINYAYWFWTFERLHYRNPSAIFGNPSIPVLLVYVCAAPLFEETIVRGYLMTEMMDLSWRPWSAALASLTLQVSYHLYYGAAGTLIIGAGLSVYAIYFARSRRIMPVMIAHLLWDLTATSANWHR